MNIYEGIFAVAFVVFAILMVWRFYHHIELFREDLGMQSDDESHESTRGDPRPEPEPVR